MQRVYFHNGLIIPSPGGALVMFDEAKECVDRLTAERDALQQLLSARDEEVDRLKNMARLTRLTIEDHEEKISALRDMLPKCKNCDGYGEIGDGHSTFDCWVCGGSGAKVENQA